MSSKKTSMIIHPPTHSTCKAIGIDFEKRNLPHIGYWVSYKKLWITEQYKNDGHLKLFGTGALLPDVKDYLENHIEDSLANAISDYILSHQEPITKWMGWASCKICKAKLGHQCMSDGNYIWPEKFEHYIIEHKISLPEEFIKSCLG